MGPAQGAGITAITDRVGSVRQRRQHSGMVHAAASAPGVSGAQNWKHRPSQLARSRRVLPGRRCVVLACGGGAVAEDGAWRRPRLYVRLCVLCLAVGPCSAVSTAAWLYYRMCAWCVGCHAGWLACTVTPRRAGFSAPILVLVQCVGCTSDLLFSIVFAWQSPCAFGSDIMRLAPDRGSLTSSCIGQMR